MGVQPRGADYVASRQRPFLLLVVETHDLSEWGQKKFQEQKGPPSLVHNLLSVRARRLIFCSQLREEQGGWEGVKPVPRAPVYAGQDGKSSSSGHQSLPGL